MELIYIWLIAVAGLMLCIAVYYTSKRIDMLKDRVERLERHVTLIEGTLQYMKKY